MKPTRGQVKARYQALLDDDGTQVGGPPAGSVFSEVVFAPAFGEAFDALYNGFLAYQIPRIELITQYNLPPMTLSLDPATAGINDFADLVELEERLAGSTDLYMHVQQRDKLEQLLPADQLLEFVWRNNQFYFNGATTMRDLRITYEASGEAPTDNNTVINVDSCLSFLSLYSAAVSGPRKGYDDSVCASYMDRAVGQFYNKGVLGGELWRLVQPLQRARQKVQVAPKPYSVVRRQWQKKVPYIAANVPPGGGGVAPVTFSTAAGTITGTLDGVNATFYLSFPVTSFTVYRNGLLMTPGTDYNGGYNVLTFLPGQIPTAGDIITVLGYLGANAAGTPTYVAGPSNAPSEGIPVGTINGSNNAFVIPGITASQLVISVQLQRNDTPQQPGIDYTRSNQNLTFLAGHVPQTGDRLYAYWWTQ